MQKIFSKKSAFFRLFKRISSHCCIIIANLTMISKILQKNDKKGF